MKYLITIFLILPFGLFAQSKTTFALTSSEYYHEVESKKGPPVKAETRITLTPTKVIIETKGEPKQVLIVQKVHPPQLYQEIAYQISPLTFVTYNLEDKTVYFVKPDDRRTIFINCKPSK